MENNNTFHYTYSAKQQEEIETIRKKYLPKEVDKMEQLRRLDQSSTRKGTAISVTVGVIGCLVLGTGMCCTMVWEERPPIRCTPASPKSSGKNWLPRF